MAAVVQQLRMNRWHSVQACMAAMVQTRMAAVVQVCLCGCRHSAGVQAVVTYGASVHGAAGSWVDVHVWLLWCQKVCMAAITVPQAAAVHSSDAEHLRKSMDQAEGQQHTMSDQIATFCLLNSMNHSHLTRKHAKCMQCSADLLCAAAAAHT